MRTYAVLGLSSALLILLSIAGAMGGGYAGFQYAKPEGMVCGLWVFPAMLIVAVATLLGFGVGLGVGAMVSAGLIRWANARWAAENPDVWPFDGEY